MTEFWRRWHISLGTWFRDYVYIPLGGNRKHQYLNIAIVWFLTGMWHGAYLNYIIWGIFHGFFLTIEKMLQQKLKLPYIIKRLITVFLIVIGFTIFRLEDISTLYEVLGKMFSFSPISIRQFVYEYNNILYCLPMFVIAAYLSFFVRNKKDSSLLSHKPVWKLLLQDFCLIALFGFSVMSIVGSGFNPFIYFRF